MTVPPRPGHLNKINSYTYLLFDEASNNKNCLYDIYKLLITFKI